MNLLMIAGGSGATIIAKLMSDNVSVMRSEGPIVTNFKHPLVMSFLMFLGEAMLLPIHRIGQFRNKQKGVVDR